MSWLFSQALVAAYSAGTSSDGAPSAPSNTTPTPQAYWSRDKTTDAWRRFPSGMTSAPLTADRGEALLTSFLAAFRARTSALPVGAQASPENAADSGARWRESSVRYDRDLSSWKTHRCLFIEVLPLSSVTLPRWGMMRDGVCWERSTPAHRTSESASGSLLRTRNLWPTPTRDSATERSTRYAQGGMPLTMAVKMWPTPTSSEHKYRLQGDSQQSKCLNALAGGSLNPTWVEWLMGWPLGWTALDASATDRYQQWRRSHGAYLEVGNETP